MKKFLVSLTLLGMAGTSVYAQEIDLKPFAIMQENQALTPGKPISGTGVINNLPAPADSIQGAIIFTIDSSGGILTAADTFAFFGPWSTMNAQGQMSFNRGFSLDGSDIDAGANGKTIFYLDNSWVPTTDSIESLLNIPYFEEHGIGNPFEDMLYRRSELVSGQTYGWYAHMRPYPNWNEGTFTDPDQTNNWSYTPVIWQAGTSIGELLSRTRYTPLEVYPNPTTDKLNFALTFSKANRSTVARVIDVNGRVLHAKALGGASSGTRQYFCNVEQLPVGNYTLQVITDNAIYISKFVRK
ncbi:T9SS type A sorting domain-containing protein [Taibaiella koreensis]|uniref:T9SS type A sorting domain-containing protein n=1 Tax=Taibaiella koreensis TaxID=1268548 RepID=UPI000E59B522|nr:T9SS type A sorting domain-containing protein [Taibaiella koreensis]